MKRIFFQEEFCMGCGLCSVYCKVQHSVTKDVIKAYKKENPEPMSRLRVEKAKPVSFPIQCRHCENAPCVNACLSGAMFVEEKTGIVGHNAKKCLGCWTCVMVCPFGTVVMDLSNNIVKKCDLCENLEVPSCVANCPNEALRCEELNI